MATEAGFHHLKGAALAIRPLLLRSDQRICGLLRILLIALRALTLLEFVARRQLAQQTVPLQGLYAGNPQRATQQPTAERLLRAFDDITWYHVADGQTTWEQVTPLSEPAAAHPGLAWHLIGKSDKTRTMEA